MKAFGKEKLNKNSDQLVWSLQIYLLF